LGGRGRRISEFKASLDYRVSSRTYGATQRNPVLKKKRKEKRKKKEKNTAFNFFPFMFKLHERRTQFNTQLIIFPSSHSAKLQLISMTPSCLQKPVPPG
jgi:hypothetical protein